MELQTLKYLKKEYKDDLSHAQRDFIRVAKNDADELSLALLQNDIGHAQRQLTLVESEIEKQCQNKQ